MSITAPATRLSIAVAAVCAMATAAFATTTQIFPVSYTNSATWQFHDSGTGELTDGLWSTTGINPIEPWMGWSSAHAQITFDFGSPVTLPVAGITVVYCDWTNAAVYLPESVEFQFSNDPSFGTFVSQTFLTPYDGHAGAETVLINYDLNLMPPTQYVRMYADSQFSWLLIGEVQFFIPTPAGATLLGLAALTATRRRRA